MASFRCAMPGCDRPVPGIYCDHCRKARAQAAEEAREANSARLKELWSTRREEMLAAIKAGKAPAGEGA